jgi:hypothetical protein
MTARGRLLAGAGVALLFLAARGPLHLAAWARPVSNDDAIPLLMARQLLRGELATTLWNQPYNGALDAYLLAPALAVADAHTAFRLYELLCGLALVALMGVLAGRVAGERAGWLAAGLAGVGTPYMALMTASGPPPNFLVPVLLAWVLRAGLRGLDARPSGSAVAACGLVAGLAVWDSFVALPILVGIGLGLAVAGLRPRLGAVAAFAAGWALGLAPLAAARFVGASAASPVTELRPRWLWEDGVAALAQASAGLLGLEVPQVVDGPERDALPVGLRVALGATLVVLVVLGAASRRAAPLVGWALAQAGAFALSRRTGPDEIRYLYGLVVPALVLAGVGLARVLRRPPVVATILGLGLVAPWAAGHRLVAARWRDPTHATRVWQVPPLGPALETLERAGVRSTYASLQFAGRLALESEGRLIASQAWNERIPADPLRFRDEVDLDPRPAWVLSPHLSRGMPRADGFRALLSELGGSWHEDQPGDLVVFRSFRAPYDESRPVPPSAISVVTGDGEMLPAAVLDRDAATAWASPAGLGRGFSLAVRVDPPRRLAALVLLVDLQRSPLAVPWIATVDGALVSRGPVRHGLQWVNGAPRAGKQALLVAPLGHAAGGDVRVVFQGPGPPLVVAEVFAYGPDEAERPAAGAEAASRALEAARTGDWDDAVRLYAEAARLEPERSSHHAALLRSRFRAAHRRWLDVEGLDDGGPELVQAR